MVSGVEKKDLYCFGAVFLTRFVVGTELGAGRDRFRRVEFFDTSARSGFGVAPVVPAAEVTFFSVSPINPDDPFVARDLRCVSSFSTSMSCPFGRMFPGVLEPVSPLPAESVPVAPGRAVRGDGVGAGTDLFAVSPVATTNTSSCFSGIEVAAGVAGGGILLRAGRFRRGEGVADGMASDVASVIDAAPADVVKAPAPVAATRTTTESKPT